VLKTGDEISFGKVVSESNFWKEKEISLSVQPFRKMFHHSSSSASLRKDVGKVYKLQPGVNRFTVGRGQEQILFLEDRRVFAFHSPWKRPNSSFSSMKQLNGTLSMNNPTRITRH